MNAPARTAEAAALEAYAQRPLSAIASNWKSRPVGVVPGVRLMVKLKIVSVIRE